MEKGSGGKGSLQRPEKEIGTETETDRESDRECERNRAREIAVRANCETSRTRGGLFTSFDNAERYKQALKSDSMKYIILHPVHFASDNSRRKTTYISSGNWKATVKEVTSLVDYLSVVVDRRQFPIDSEEQQMDNAR